MPAEGMGIRLVFHGTFGQHSWCRSHSLPSASVFPFGWAGLCQQQGSECCSGHPLLILVEHPGGPPAHTRLGTARSPSPFSSSISLWLPLPAQCVWRGLGAAADAGGVFAAPGPAATCPRSGGLMGRVLHAGFASTHPTGSSVPASPALADLLCWEAWREGLRMGIAARVSRADNYFWGKDAVF